MEHLPKPVTAAVAASSNTCKNYLQLFLLRYGWNTIVAVTRELACRVDGVCQTVEWRSEVSSAMSASPCPPPNLSNAVSLLIDDILFLRDTKYKAKAFSVSYGTVIQVTGRLLC